MSLDTAIRFMLGVIVAQFLASNVGRTADIAVIEPDGYRMDDYRSPVPDTLRGAQVIGTHAAHELWDMKYPIFVDVMPRLARPDKLPAGTVWRDKVRRNIPGSHWLANVGYGALTPEAETYFRKSLGTLTASDASRKLVFYCMTSCWMSWNAAKRAVAWGYTDVVWYPMGADGWAEAKFPLAVAQPFLPP